MVSPLKFKYELIYEGGFDFLSFLTCPECNCRYQLRHHYCGMSLSVEDALTSHMCDFCLSNGQTLESRLPLEVADCPQCGHKCRAIDDIDYPKKTRKIRNVRRKKLPSASIQDVSQHCKACGFARGLEIHHKDWDHTNDNPENLLVLCKWCHMQVHKLGKPEFERMLEVAGANPSLRTALRRSAEDFYNKLQRHTNPTLGGHQLE